MPGNLDGQPSTIQRARSLRRRAATVGGLVLLVTFSASVALGGFACGAKLAGAAGSGDPYFPNMGNGGYDVLDYQLDLQVDPAAGRLVGSALVEAKATQDLDTFDLDFTGLQVQTIQVDGGEARWQRKGQELIVSAPARLRVGSTFKVLVSYSGVPRSLTMADGSVVGWQKSGDSIFTLDEPEGAATWFPVNDTPLDKATYSFRITVPEPYTAAANGALAQTVANGNDQTFVWEMKQPMASYLAAVYIGKFVLSETTGPGATPIRNYFADSLADPATKAFAATPEVLAFYGGLFGPYPFAAYGVAVPDADTLGAMENQTMSLYGRNVLEKDMSDPTGDAIYLSHELAHQWFGDSVTLEHWSDIWLNEGFATYCSWLWLGQSRGQGAFDAQVKNSYDAVVAKRWSPPGKPPADDLFNDGVYYRGALTLQAVRLTVGDDVFFRILRTWAERFKYKNVSTADFIGLVQEVSGRDLRGLIDSWLYDSAMPALPGGGTAA